MQEKENEDLNLTLTMQQKFNFESNSFDEEDTRTYRIRKKQIIVRRKREKEIIKLKNKYKRKYKISIVLIVFLFIFCSIVTGLLIITKNEKKEANACFKGDENIVLLGDSLTDYYDLEAYYGSKYHLVNSGKGGNTTDDILNDMNERVYKYNPSKVFILIGINDMKKKKSNDYIYNNILKIVSEIEKNRKCAKIYVESLYPINESNNKKIYRHALLNRSNKKVNQINSRLKKEFSETDITYIDINRKLKDDDGNLKIDYTKEGIHLSKEGYEEVTKLLLKYIEE